MSDEDELYEYFLMNIVAKMTGLIIHTINIESSIRVTI